MSRFLILAFLLLALNAVAAETPKPFIMVTLDAAPFHGATPQITRARVDAFVAKLGWRMSFYQDNDAKLAVTVRPRLPEETGPLAAIRRSFDRLRFEKTLRDAHLGDVVEIGDRGDRWDVLLTPPLYEDAVRRGLKSLYAPSELVFQRNKAMEGSLYIRFPVDGIPDAKSYAARLPKEHAEIREAGVYVEVVTMEVKMGGAAPR